MHLRSWQFTLDPFADLVSVHCYNINTVVHVHKMASSLQMPIVSI